MTTQTEPYARFLGGESGHRSFFGGTQSRARVALVGLFVIGGMILTILIGLPGLIIGLGGGGLTILLTARTHRGSIVERVRKRRRWRDRLQQGTDAFIPYDIAAWDQLQQAAADAHGRRAKWSARRELAAMRSRPDGADGLGWLQHGRREPGIAWHAPRGEQNYLSVTFTVSGQLRGLESDAVMNRAAESWGMFLASRAAPTVLVGRVQTMTRVLPADSALQEAWVLRSLDEEAPADAVRSYEDVLRLTGAGSMVQRHYVTVSWPLTSEFTATATKYGRGRAGWRALMAQEIDSTIRGLTEARMGTVHYLTARQTAALILHQQDPSRPLDFVQDVNPARLGVPSHDEFSAHVVAGTDPMTAASTQWWHRTAKITAAGLATAPRNQLWMLALLLGSDVRCIRSISFHIQLVPAAEAKAAARRDLLRDLAEVISREEAGQMNTDDVDVAMTAASRRNSDLKPGSSHHGANWVGYVTVTERSRDSLAQASRQLADTCATSLGVEQLEWMDSYQSAASGTTWPIGRGITAAAPSFSARVFRGLAGRTEKEAIS